MLMGLSLYLSLNLRSKLVLRQVNIDSLACCRAKL